MAKLPRGVALSGLEFGSKIPGSESIDYFKPSNADIDDFTGKGMSLFRIPFMWERMQPILGGALDTAQLGYLQGAIDEIKLKGAKAIIEPHNFGRRSSYADGGITENFTANPEVNLVYPWADYTANGSIVLRNYGESFFGTVNNPVAPAGSYIVSFNMKFNARDDNFGGEGLYVRVMKNATNGTSYYEFGADLADNTWSLTKVIGGISTTLSSGAQTWGTTNTYAVVIDVGQTTTGKINVTLNGVALFTNNSIATDANLTHGLVSFYAPGVHVKIDTLILNINGDTSSGGQKTHIIGGVDGAVTIAHFADLWSKLATHFKTELGISAYDLMNEPYGMAVPTTPLNYNTTATITLMHRAAVTAIRATGDTHQIFVETDEFSGLQNFVAQYGTNPTFWISDPLGKTGLSCHYYPDSNHSGSFTGANNGFLSTYFDRVDTEVPPALVWAKANNITMFIGEYGIPDDPLWYPTLNKILTYMDTNSAWGTYWAAGVFYSAITGVEPTSNYTVDKGQLTTLLAHLPDIFVQPTSPPPVSGTAGVGSAIGLLLALTYATGSGTGGGTVTPPAPPPSNVWRRRRSSGVKWTRVTHR